eukprot:1189162-Prorocentrum_minimum.AAC.2
MGDKTPIFPSLKGTIQCFAEPIGARPRYVRNVVRRQKLERVNEGGITETLLGHKTFLIFPLHDDLPEHLARVAHSARWAVPLISWHIIPGLQLTRKRLTPPVQVSAYFFREIGEICVNRQGFKRILDGSRNSAIQLSPSYAFKSKYREGDNLLRLGTSSVVQYSPALSWFRHLRTMARSLRTGGVSVCAPVIKKMSVTEV